MTHSQTAKIQFLILTLLAFTGLNAFAGFGAVSASAAAPAVPAAIKAFTCDNPITKTAPRSELDPSTITLLDKIEKIAGGSLTSQRFTTAINGQGVKGGDIVFNLNNDSDDGTLMAQLNSLDDETIGKLIAANHDPKAGFVQKAKDLAEDLKNQAIVRSALMGGQFVFNAQICLSPDETAFSVHLVGIPEAAAVGVTGDLIATSSKSAGGIDVSGAFASDKYPDQPPTQFTKTVFRGDDTGAAQ
jgi:hypothetical protein